MDKTQPKAMRTDADYRCFDPFDGDRDSNIKCRTVAIVKVRKEHECFIGQCTGETPHKIQSGERARYEKALVDNEFWGRYYVCLPCMDKWLDDL